MKPYRYFVVEDPTTDRALIVDSEYTDSLSGKPKNRVVAVDAEPLMGLVPSAKGKCQAQEICDVLNAPYIQESVLMDRGVS